MDNSSVIGGLFGLLFSLIFSLGIYLVSAYIMYMIGKKFGVGSFIGYCIPIYNLILLCRCAGIDPLSILLCLIPGIGGIIFSVMLYGKIAERLGKSFWVYGIFSFFLIPILILAFDSSTPIQSNNGGVGMY